MNRNSLSCGAALLAVPVLAFALGLARSSAQKPASARAEKPVMPYLPYPFTTCYGYCLPKSPSYFTCLGYCPMRQPPYAACMGYCPKMQRSPYYTCYGYCPTPQAYTCYGYCPYPQNPFSCYGYCPSGFGNMPKKGNKETVPLPKSPSPGKTAAPRATAALDVTPLAGRSAKPAIPGLLRLLENDDPDVRIKAVAALEAIGPAAVPSLIQALKSPSSYRRMGAALTLARLGPVARKAVPALRETLSDKILRVRAHAAQALWHIDACHADEVRPVLTAALKAPDRRIREGAALVLGQMGPRARTAMHALHEGWKDSAILGRRERGDSP